MPVILRNARPEYSPQYADQNHPRFSKRFENISQNAICGVLADMPVVFYPICHKNAETAIPGRFYARLLIFLALLLYIPGQKLLNDLSRAQIEPHHVQVIPVIRAGRVECSRVGCHLHIYAPRGRINLRPILIERLKRMLTTRPRFRIGQHHEHVDMPPVFQCPFERQCRSRSTTLFQARSPAPRADMRPRLRMSAVIGSAGMRASQISLCRNMSVGSTSQGSFAALMISTAVSISDRLSCS